MEGGHIAEAVDSVRKAGTVVLTGTGGCASRASPSTPPCSPCSRSGSRGALFGGCNPRWDIPHLLDQYAAGTLLPDELVTRTYALEQVAQGYADMKAGRSIRGVVLFD